MDEDEKDSAAMRRARDVAGMLSGCAFELRERTGADKVLIVVLKATRTGVGDSLITGTSGMEKTDIVPALAYCITMFKSDTAVMISPKADA